MEPQILLAMAIVFAAGWVAGLAAFGFTLVAVPPLLMIFDPPAVVATVILLVLITRWVVLLGTWRSVVWRPVLAALPCGIVGVGFGAIMLRELDPTYIRLLAGVVVLSVALLMLGGWSVPGAHSRLAPPVAGLLSGTLETSVGMSAPPIVLCFASRGYSVAAFRGSMTVIFYVVAIAGITLLAQQRLFGREELQISSVLLPMAIAGTFFGRFSLRWFPPDRFRRLILVMLCITGGVGTLAALTDIVG